MGRKAFIADLVTASRLNLPRLHNIERGTEDGDVKFQFSVNSSDSIAIFLIADDITEYPLGCQFTIYAKDSEKISGTINYLITRLNSSGECLGKTIPELCVHIADHLSQGLGDGTFGNPFTLDDTVMQDEDSDGYEDWPDDFDTHAPSPTEQKVYVAEETAVKINKRIRHDIRLACENGFRVGIIQGMKADSAKSIMSLSILVDDLDISDEALQAWNFQKSRYATLLIRYERGYKSFETVIAEPLASHGISYRVGVSSCHKPSLRDAIAAFTNGNFTFKPNNDDISHQNTDSGPSESTFERFFISDPLNQLLNDKFQSILKIRHGTNSDWDRSNLFLQEKLGQVLSIDSDDKDCDLSLDASLKIQGDSLAIVGVDHLEEANQITHLSFPLIAMEFFIRYLSKCTEFCLVCHNPLPDSFVSLKPYVCSRPLCLYQYMNLGFGPSIEHEILTQPYVVDLLVSFCYGGACNRRLREYPTGMNLLVPSVSFLSTPATHMGELFPNRSPEPLVEYSSVALVAGSEVHKVSYDAAAQEATFQKLIQLNSRNWVMIRTERGDIYHHKVIDVYGSVIKLSSTSVFRPSGSTIHGAQTTSIASSSQGSNVERTPGQLLSAELFIYQMNFDELSNDMKADTIMILLDSLPTITAMRLWLKHRRSGQSDTYLSQWTERISPAALGLLRWIIASNRSYIVQIDDLGSEGDSTVDRSRSDERVRGVEGYHQFRFVQGAPDKELRFKRALQDTTNSQNPHYPTMFAWHGSNFGNWHDIIRSGLDFKDVINGRAYGNGCYFSPSLAISLGYCGRASKFWKGSVLKIHTALCMNEIINAPSLFQSSQPHLVVQHVDWIQTRYLFVAGESTAVIKPTKTGKPSAEVQQDPSYSIRGERGEILKIPAKAFPSSSYGSSTSKSLLIDHSRKSSNDNLRVEPAVQRQIEDADLVDFLVSDTEDGVVDQSRNENNRKVDDKSHNDSPTTPRPDETFHQATNFVPGAFDISTIRRLPSPSFATPTATRQLQRELKVALGVQEKTPFQELGWFINRDLLDNVYQWVVELHSFENSLPLAKDLKAAGLGSVVIELLFGKDFPMTPPFVRVIRPRFLPFAAGGGGHVTAGGALCMELLTNDGWSAVSSIESVLLQVRMAISSTEPRPARLENRGKKQGNYSVFEAVDAFIRACQAHGWEVPNGFLDFSKSLMESSGPIQV